MAAWIMACRICFQVIFFELFIGIFVLKDLFFCHSGQRRGICGHKNDCIQILHFVQNNSFISERQIFTEIQVYFRVTVSFQKGKIRSDFRSPESSGVFFRLVIWSGSLSRQVHGVFPAFRALTTSLAAFRVGTRLNTLSFSKLRKRVPAFQRTFRSSTWMAGLYVSSDSAPMLLI